MSATTFAGGAVELHTFGDIAPFNVLDPPPRQRSSSLSAPLHAEMPGLWSRTGAGAATTKPRSRVSSASQNTTPTSVKATASITTSPVVVASAVLKAEGSAIPSPTPVLGHRSSRQKITEKGKKERRLSVSHRSSNDSEGQPSSSPVMDGVRQPLDSVTRAETPSDGEGNVQIARANAYAALTGAGSGPSSQTASSSTALSAPHVTPTKTPRRTRIQSASAVASSSSPSAYSPASANAPPAVTPTRKKRRSLSQQNSLIATRIAKAFLLRELGEAALARRCTTAVPKSSWSQDDAEQRELWFALHDGVLLCRLLNHIISDSIPYIDRRDITSAKLANIAAFLQALKANYSLSPHELFDVEHLYSGSPSGFERVLHTICVLAEASIRHAQSRVSESSSPLPQSLSPSMPSLVADARTAVLSSPSSGHSVLPPLHSPASADFGRVASPNTDYDRSPSPAISPVTTSSTPPRPSRILSNNGIKIRSRTTSRPESSSPAIGSRLPVLHDRRSSLSPTTGLPSGLPSHHHHAIYGKNADKRMSESAVNIMTVVKEGEEMPFTRRAASDKPSFQHRFSDSDCTPAKKRSAESARRPTRSPLGELDTNISNDNLPSASANTPDIAMSPALRASRLRQSAAGADILKGSPSRIAVRKRVASSAAATAGSVSPTPYAGTSGFSSNSASSNEERAKSASPPLLSSRLSPSQLGFGTGHMSTPHLPFPRTPSYSKSKMSSTSHPDADEENNGPAVPPAAASPANQRPRQLQHKRWNSEVAHNPVGLGRPGHSAAQARSRHDSYMDGPSTPAAGRGISVGSHAHLRTGDPLKGLRRRSMDRTQTSDYTRQRIVVTEVGKAPVIYQLGECIGRGQFGSVYRALNIHTGSIVAVKRIRLADKTEDECLQLQKEVDLLKSLSHPSVTKYEGLVRTEHYLNIVMEYVENGSLLHTLNAFGNLSEGLVASYVVKILEGLSYLHSVQVIHRDLKAANILTTKNGNIKLSDFGVSLQLNAVHNTIENADATGTPNWMAPEVIKLEKPSCASDIWSLACTIVELITGKPPYSNLLAMTAMFKIVEDDMPPLPSGCSPELADFLKLCFRKTPHKRPTAQELFHHKWLSKHWMAHKNLRPQDSIPFLRRISSEYHSRPGILREPSTASDNVPELDISVSSPSTSALQYEEPASPPMQYLDKQIDVIAIEDRSPRNQDFLHGNDLDVLTSEMLRQEEKQTDAMLDMARSAPNAYPFPMAPSPSLLPIDAIVAQDIDRAHSFVKTTFSKPIECKLCRQPIKRHALLCEGCALFCHPLCKEYAPRSCTLNFPSHPPPLPPASALPIPTSAIPTSPSNMMLASSMPLIEPSPLTSPSQFAFHSKFGLGNLRRPKASPQSSVEGAGPPSPAGSSSHEGNISPYKLHRGVSMLRTKTDSPERVGGRYLPHQQVHHSRPASSASSGSIPRFPRTSDNQASLSGSSASHALSVCSSSIAEDHTPSKPVLAKSARASAARPPLPSGMVRNDNKAALGKDGKVKKPKRESKGDCIIS